MSEQAATMAIEPGRYYILVLGDNGVYDDQNPYHLQVKITPLGAIGCTWSPRYAVGQAAAAYTGMPTGTYPYSQPLTLILVNKLRMDATYGVTETSALMTSLHNLADHPKVQGIVVPVENDGIVSSTYELWNGSYCDPTLANDVADAIREQVVFSYFNTYPSLEYVVVVGSDEQIPFYRIPDETRIANERTYESSAYLGFGAARAALATGYYLTDDFYGDPYPLAWRNRWLAVQRYPVGRLVERPSEIRAMIGSFLQSNGVLTATGAVATGYDFLIDSATAISDTLGWYGLGVDPLIGESWDANDLDRIWTQNPSQQIASINAHFAHFEAYPALTTSAPFSNTAVVNAVFTGTLGFSMGCHAGLNVADAEVAAAHPETIPDFPQALAQRASLWVANTGYGYGMDDSIALSERLMHLFARELGRVPNVPVGQALRKAKLRYLGSLPSGGLSLYHAKVLMEAALYGLPMTEVHLPHPRSPMDEGMGQVSDPIPTGVGDLFVITATVQPTLTRHAVQEMGGQGVEQSHSVYYSVLGDVQASPGRPVQPRATLALTSPFGYTAHGALFFGGHYTHETNFNPYVSRPVTDVALPEPEFTFTGWYPDKPFFVNRFGDQDRLVVIPGQYNHSLEAERLYDDLQLLVFYSTSDDFLSPTIWKVEATQFLDTVDFQARVTDASGVYRVLVTYSTGDNRWQSMDLTYDEDSGFWTGSLSGLEDSLRFFVQAVDEAGNVAMSANKGLLLEAEKRLIYLPLVIKNGS